MANDVLFGIFVYILSCISTTVAQESEYLECGLSDIAEIGLFIGDGYNADLRIKVPLVAVEVWPKTSPAQRVIPASK